MIQPWYFVAQVSALVKCISYPYLTPHALSTTCQLVLGDIQMHVHDDQSYDPTWHDSLFCSVCPVNVHSLHLHLYLYINQTIRTKSFLILRLHSVANRKIKRTYTRPNGPFKNHHFISSLHSLPGIAAGYLLKLFLLYFLYFFLFFTFQTKHQMTMYDTTVSCQVFVLSVIKV